MSPHLIEEEIIRREKDFDPILPVQFFEQRRANILSLPQMRLMAAVLEEAFVTLLKPADCTKWQQRRLLEETEKWFASTDTIWPFSFENICASLGIEADFLRERIARWKLKQHIA